MTRKEAYEKINEMGLQDTVKNLHGRNYTQVSTGALEQIIRDYTKNGCTAVSQEEAGEEKTFSAYEAACLAFLGILKDADILDDLLKEL